MDCLKRVFLTAAAGTASWIGLMSITDYNVTPSFIAVAGVGAIVGSSAFEGLYGYLQADHAKEPRDAVENVGQFFCAALPAVTATVAAFA